MRSRLARIDYAGSVTLVFFIGSFLLGISLKTSSELLWSDPRVWGLFVTSGVSGLAFLWVEAFFAAEPVLPLTLLREVSFKSQGQTLLLELTERLSLL